MYNYAQYAAFACRSGDLSKAPKNCPCLEEDRDEILEKYFSDENQKLAYFSALFRHWSKAKATAGGRE